jgi:hypothetical protein
MNNESRLEVGITRDGYVDRNARVFREMSEISFDSFGGLHKNIHPVIYQNDRNVSRRVMSQLVRNEISLIILFKILAGNTIE